jgi:hypothetical protein
MSEKRLRKSRLAARTESGSLLREGFYWLIDSHLEFGSSKGFSYKNSIFPNRTGLLGVEKAQEIAEPWQIDRF